MHRRILTALALVMLVLGLGPAAVAAPVGTPATYLALGDSYAAGTQPGQEEDLAGGYAGGVLQAYQDLAPGAELTNLACPGERIGSYRDGGRYCSYEGSQRDAALAFLEQHPQTGLITIDLGGNDVQTCVEPSTGGIDFACLQEGLSTIRTELPVLLGELRAAAPQAQIVLTNYPDVFLASWLAGPSGQEIARLSVSLVGSLNDIYEGAASAAGADFADVSDAFSTTDFTLVADPVYGKIPRNVAAVCSWTWMCERGDIHPNDEGYAVIASVIAAVLEPPAGPTEPPATSSPTAEPSTTTTSAPAPSAGGPSTPRLVQTDSSAAHAASGWEMVLLLVLAGALLAGTVGTVRRVRSRH